MRTKEEIERALTHLCQAMVGCQLAGEYERIEELLPTMDLLAWVLGAPSKFATTFESMDKIDRDERRHEVN